MNTRVRYALMAIVGLVVGGALMGYALANPTETQYTGRGEFSNGTEYTAYKAGVLSSLNSPHIIAYSINDRPYDNSMSWSATVTLGHTLPYGTAKGRPHLALMVPGCVLVLMSIILGLPYLHELVKKKAKGGTK